MTPLVRRRLSLITASLLAAAAAVALTLVFTKSDSGSTARPPTPASPGPDEVARFNAIQTLMRERSAAIVGRDRAAFMATIDPQSKAFRHSQGRMFAHLAPVPLATWSYDLTATPRRPPPRVERYDAPTWAPSYFVVHYRLAGFDDEPTTLQQYPTFVQRERRWYLASFTDYASRRLVSATDIWDFGPVKVLRRPGVLVLGAPSQEVIMRDVARRVRDEIDAVTRVWGEGWKRRAVVLVPRTMREMALICDYRGDLRNIAALTSAEVSTTAGSPTPVGDRITINPVNWPVLSDIGAEVVIRHELTHVATRAATGTQTPTWLSEGFADYVGFLDAPVSIDVAAAALKRSVDAGDLPEALPTNRDFRRGDSQLAMHYEAAWFACRYIAEHFDEATLVRFYRAVGTSPLHPRQALAAALRSDLHLRLGQFVARWRSYIAREL